MVWGLLSVGWFLHRPTDQRQRQLVVGGEPQHLSTRGWRSERGTHQKEVRLGWAMRWVVVCWRRKSRPPKRIAVISCSAMRAVKFAIYPKDRRCFITNLCLVLFARNGSGGAAGAMGQGARVRFVAFQTGSFGSVALVVWFLGLARVAWSMEHFVAS